MNYDGVRVIVSGAEPTIGFRAQGVMVEVYWLAAGMHIEVRPFCKGEVPFAEWVAEKLRQQAAIAAESRGKE